MALDGLLDKATLNALLAEVLAITKVGRGWCSDCKKAVMVEVPDAKAVVSASSLYRRRAVRDRRPTTRSRHS